MWERHHIRGTSPSFHTCRGAAGENWPLHLYHSMSGCLLNEAWDLPQHSFHDQVQAPALNRPCFSSLSGGVSSSKSVSRLSHTQASAPQATLPNSIAPSCLVLGRKVVDVKAREVPRFETTPGSVQVYPCSVVCLLKSLRSKKVFGVNKEAI